MFKKISVVFLFLASLAIPAFGQDEMIQLYLCSRIGIGTRVNPYRPSIADLPVAWNGAGTEWYDNIDHPGRAYFVSFVHGSQTTHDLCATVATPLLPTPSATGSEMRVKLDALIDSGPSAWKAAVVADLEAKGVSTAWLGATNSPRDAIRYMLRLCLFGQNSIREGGANLFDFLTQNLDVRVNQLTVAQRDAARTWMQSRGLDTNWITGQTTVRQVLHYILQNLGFGVIRWHNEDFD